jgi:hypothetical protein
VPGFAVPSGRYVPLDLCKQVSFVFARLGQPLRRRRI